MESKKALLILFGGRSMPNMLTIINEKPEQIIAIVSQDAIQQLPQFQNSIDELFKNESEDAKPQLDVSYIVGAFNREDVYKKCLQAVEKHSGFDWIFNVTAGTTIMSIGAYEAAKVLNTQGQSVKCWYLNTSHSNVISLIDSDKENLIDDEKNKSIFHIDLNQYVAVYNRKLAPKELGDQRKYCEDNWIPFANFLGQNSHYVDILKKEILSATTPRQPSKKGGPSKFVLHSPSKEACILLDMAYDIKLLNNLQKENDIISWKFNYIQAGFLNGPWLEAYVWDEARKLKLFSDCQWNQILVNPQNLSNSQNKNELDVAMIHRAQLLVAECKTSEDPFKNQTLYDFDSVTGQLGGKFVSRMLITSNPTPEKKSEGKQDNYEDFKIRADERGIVIINREKLKDIRSIIEQQVNNPKYARI